MFGLLACLGRFSVLLVAVLLSWGVAVGLGLLVLLRVVLWVDWVLF